LRRGKGRDPLFLHVFKQFFLKIPGRSGFGPANNNDSILSMMVEPGTVVYPGSGYALYADVVYGALM
jgi:hypothetical protein